MNLLHEADRYAELFACHRKPPTFNDLGRIVRQDESISEPELYELGYRIQASKFNSELRMIPAPHHINRLREFR